MKSAFYALFLIFLLALSAEVLMAQNVDYSAYCIATRMKHNCDGLANEEGRFSVQISDNLNFGVWYRAGNGSGNMSKCLICDGDANTTNGYTCTWNIPLVSKTNVSVNTVRLSFRATDDDAMTVVDDWWMDDDCTYTLSGLDVPFSGLTAAQNNDMEVGQSVDPQWYVTYRIFFNYVTVGVPSAPLAAQNPSCGPTSLVVTPSTQTDVTWYWQGANASGTSTLYPSSASFPVDTSGVYYLRAKGNTNNVWSTTSASVYVEIKSGSTAASGINVTNNNTPQGTIKTLSVIGGILGSGADWQWYLEPGCINTAGTGSFIDVDPPVTTAYYARAEGDCDSTLTVSTTVVVSSSGIGQFDLNGNAVRIYPNPVEDLMIVELSHAEENGTASIYNFQGQRMHTFNLDHTRIEVITASLSPGCYWLRMTTGNEAAVHKFIVR